MTTKLSIRALLTALFAFVVGRLQRRAHKAKRRERREQREARLSAVRASAHDLVELTELVDRCIPCGSVDPFDLDALLDRYVDVALARHRCRYVLTLASPNVLRSRLARTQNHPKAALVRQKRLAHAEHTICIQRDLDESLATIGELVRHYAERVAPV